MKFYVKSIFGNYLSNELKFNTAFENVMYFDSIEKAKEALSMYRCDNCIIKSTEN